MSETPPFRTLGRTLIYQGFTRLEALDVEQVSRSGAILRMRREIETHGSGVAVLAYDPRLRIAVLVRQLRFPVGLIDPGNAFVLEAIAGLIDDPSQSAEATVRREAVEEAGLELSHVVPVAAAYSSPGISTEKLHLFLAEIDLAAARIADGGGLLHEHEDIEVVEIPLAELAALADSGAILDMKTLALTQTLRLRHPDLF